MHGCGQPLRWLVPLGAALLSLPTAFAADTTQPEATAAPIPVEVRPLGELAVYPQRRAPATVVSDNNSRLNAEVAGRIREVRVRVGDNVQAGAVLVVLDDADLLLALRREQAALDALQADLDLARYQLERARTLSRQQAVSEELLRQREAAVAGLQARTAGQAAALAQAERRLAKTRLHAPFAGLVSERLAQVGELASPGSPLLRLVDLEHLEVSARLGADLAAHLPPRVELDTNGRRYALRLRRLLPVFDTRARTREARLAFVAATAPVGSAGELVWRETRPAIPAALLLRREGQLGVFVVEAGQARFRPLPDAEAGRPALTDLPASTLLVTAGRFRLADGAKVSPGR